MYGNTESLASEITINLMTFDDYRGVMFTSEKKGKIVIEENCTAPSNELGRAALRRKLRYNDSLYK